jgi:mannose-6-phosphate isomerase-like protein (cupin superfamily)
MANRLTKRKVEVMIEISQQEMEHRLVRYAHLRPCTSAFIDAHTPGSERKENFTIIGRGVAENPDQFVHITIPHGFNIGGARQPPGCTNSQHSHDTAEVFIIHSGNWRFVTGENGQGPSVDLGPGDTISIPVHIFRGFENIGNEVGFMFSVLGGDDPGRVTWAPYVFEAAERHGLVLLDNGRLIDTAKASLPPDSKRMPVTSADDVAKCRSIDSTALAECVLSIDDLSTGGGLSAIPGFEECAVIGAANPAERMPAGKINWPHGFQLRALRMAPGALSPSHVRDEEEVLMVHRGQTQFEWANGRLDLGPGDILTVPKSLERSYLNHGITKSLVYIVRGGNNPKQARFVSTNVQR